MTIERKTIKEIAQEANVSTTTVSRYINRSGYIKEETALRIAKIIESNDYSPNITARGLKTRNSKVILLVVPDISNPFYAEIAKRVQEIARNQKYVITLFDTGGDSDEELAAIQVAHQMFVSGILFATIDVKQSVQKAIQGCGIATIGLNAFEHCLFDSVHVHNNGGTYLSTKHLIQLGHTNIAFAGGTPGTVIALSRKSGYIAAMKETGLEINESNLFEMGFSLNDGYKAGLYFSTLNPMPSAICCANDLLALGVISAMSDQNIHIPKDISVTGMDNICYSKTSNPKLTTVTNESTIYADTSMQMLFERLLNNYSGPPRSIEISHELLIRDSTGPYHKVKE